MACKRIAADETAEFREDIGKAGSLGKIFIADPGQVRDERSQPAVGLGLEKGLKFADCAAALDQDGPDFNDGIAGRIEPCRFNIDNHIGMGKDEGPLSFLSSRFFGSGGKRRERKQRIGIRFHEGPPFYSAGTMS